MLRRVHVCVPMYPEQATAPQSGYCEHHRPFIGGGYTGWHEWADEQMRAGYRQMTCEGCGKWLWTNEWGGEPTPAAWGVYPKGPTHLFTNLVEDDGRWIMACGARVGGQVTLASEPGSLAPAKNVTCLRCAVHVERARRFWDELRDEVICQGPAHERDHG